MKKDMSRVRVGKANAAILAGEADLSTWSDEELVAGRRKGVNGRFGGRAPLVVPKVIHDEWVSRRMLEAHKLLGENLVKAVQVLVDIATDKQADAAVRVKAATTIMDRVLGKVPDHVVLSNENEPTWAKAIRAGMVQAIITRAPDDEPAQLGAGDIAPSQRVNQRR